ncbi:MAG: hypothetical protein H7840_13350 [Alphaproteobacteria bacterium]
MSEFLGKRSILVAAAVAGLMLAWLVGSLISTLGAVAQAVTRVGDEVHAATASLVAIRQDSAQMVATMAAVNRTLGEMNRDLVGGNRDLATIQHGMAEDMRLMRKTMDGMGRDVTALNMSVGKMTVLMGRVSYDMNRVASATFPLGYPQTTP